MNIFLTGASGFVGSAVARELLTGKHRVVGLVRDAAKGRALSAPGLEVVTGLLDDHDLLRRHARQADAVIHTAFDHDWSRFAHGAEQDRLAIEALGEALRGSDKPLLVTSGLSGLARNVTENDPPATAGLRKSDATAHALRAQGVRASTVRLAPSVHGEGDRGGFATMLIKIARDTRVSGYVDNGTNCWSGVHRADAARLYRLAVEDRASQPVYHAVAEESIELKRIAEAIGSQLGVPVESRPREHFGWFATMVAGNMSASSKHTRQHLGWNPTGPGLFADLAQPFYYR